MMGALDTYAKQGVVYFIARPSQASLLRATKAAVALSTVSSTVADATSHHIARHCSDVAQWAVAEAGVPRQPKLVALQGCCC